MHEAPLQVILGVFASPTRAGDVRSKLRENERLERETPRLTTESVALLEARGRVLAEGDYKTVSQNPEVREAYMGTGHA